MAGPPFLTPESAHSLTDVQSDWAECRERDFTSRQRGICPAGEGVPCVSRPCDVVLQRELRWARNIRVCVFRVVSPIMITYVQEANRSGDRFLQNPLAIKYGHRIVYLLATFLVRRTLFVDYGLMDNSGGL